ncbi:hypothetical protein GCM10007160_31970 [Litchfieldella qijiaojingensis]|uniref:Flippase-like domain-containing protein n=1 Tax=Litchfieldella qijiaojingensis TaxID=980347 RepID=A0ABQ2Z162_9GAMM|nr:flippase-like domain-containing protein [Halomonas qijiaojingensis]GGY01641.1 hypothetical protein GCM10007160_31970 [Halomonas qijiaojingensis]
MTRYTAFAALSGLAVVVALVAWQGVGTLFDALAIAGWQLAWLPLYFLLVMVLAAMAWQWLLPPGKAPKLGVATYMTGVGLAVNWLLPVAMVGGEAVRAHLLVRRRHAAAEAVASVIADKTVQVATQVAFAVLGLLLLIGYGAEGRFLLSILAGVAVLTAALVAFYLVQRRGGIGGSARYISRLLGPERARRLQVTSEEVDQALQSTYERRARLCWAFGLRFAARMVWAGEVLIALALLGHPVGVLVALIIESLTQAARAAAFVIPGGLGAQEAGIVVIGLAVGLPAEVCLALAVVKRGRELAVGLPVLGYWQLEEARYWSRRRRRERGSDDRVS